MTTEVNVNINVRTKGAAVAAKRIDRIRKSASGTRKALAFMRAALVVAASVRVLGGFVTLADSFTIMQNRLKLVTNNMGELNAVMGTLFDISQNTRTEFEANVNLFSKLQRATTSLDATYRDLTKATEAAALATKISGATSQEASSGLQQFAQAMASGILGGDELRSVTENLPRLASLIGKEFGIAGGELRAFGKANPGVLETNRIFKALLKSLPTLTKEFALTVPTISDGFVQLKNALQVFIGQTGQASGIAAGFARSLKWVADNLGLVTAGLAFLLGTLALRFLIGQALFLAKLLGGAVILAIKGVWLAFKTMGKVGVAAFRLIKFGLSSFLRFAIGATGIGIIILLFFAFREEIGMLLTRLDDVTQIFNDIAAVGVAVVKTIIKTWRLFPGAILEIAKLALHNFRTGFLTAVAVGLNTLIKEMSPRLRRFLGLEKEGKILQFTVNKNLKPGLDKVKEIMTAFAVEIKSNFKLTEFIKEQFGDLQAFLDKFTGFNFDPSLLDNKGPGQTTATKSLSARAQKRLDGLIASISPLADFNAKIASTQAILNSAIEAGIDLYGKYGLTATEVMDRIKREALGVGNALEVMTEKHLLLNKALKLNKISATEFKIAYRDATLESLQNSTTFVDGARRGILSLMKDYEDFAAGTESSIVSAFQRMEDSILSFVKTGKFGIGDLFQFIADEVTKLAIRMLLLKPLLGFLEGFFTTKTTSSFGQGFGPGGPGTTGGSSLFDAPNFSATGGRVAGPGTGKSDSILTALSNGEFVMTAAVTKRFLPLLEALNSSVGGFAAGGAVGNSAAISGGFQAGLGGITFAPQVHISVEGGSSGSAEDDAAFARKMGEKVNMAIEVKFKELMQKNLRPGGMLNRAR